MACAVGIKKEVLDDLASRFLINMPQDEKDKAMKVCAEIEQAYWFYLDFLRPEDPSLPGCSYKEFMATIFQHCSSLVKSSLTVDALADKWKAFKHNKPVRGAILLNKDLTKCLLVQGYPASTSWGFPKGKLESGETDIDAAVREVYEEVGLDIRELIKEDHYLDMPQRDARMYIIPGIPEDQHFEPRVRKEIKSIQWFNVNDLPCHRHDQICKNNLKLNPNKFFVIIPFMERLKEWILHHPITLDQLTTTPLYYHTNLQPSHTFYYFEFDKQAIYNAYHNL